MPIDVSVPHSPGWWMQRLFNQLASRSRYDRLRLLHNFRIGHAPLPEGAENAREAYAAFQKKARSNFAELIVSAVSERMSPVGFRTALDADETGDAEVGAMWERAGLDVASSDVHDLMLSLSEAYVIVGAVDPDTEAPLVTAENPLFMAAEADPANPRKLLAALKVLRDDANREDRAYLFLPGSGTDSGRAEVWVAVRPLSAVDMGTVENPSGPITMFSKSAYTFDNNRKVVLDHPKIPVVRFLNKDALGEYEAHLDLLGRINHQVLQRMVIATMTAFRQKAIKGLPLVDGNGKEIDYTGVFTSDPAALWQLPETAQMWESQQSDLRPILDAVKDDLQHLASVTRTPMHMLQPSGQNQSAEGATLQREGLVFKCRDRITRTSYPWAQVASLMMLADGQPDRADLSKLRTIWAPPEHLSLAERADAAVKAKDDLPRRFRLTYIWGLSPAEADRAMTEMVDDQLLASQVATATAALAPPTGAVAVAPNNPAPPVDQTTATSTPGQPPVDTAAATIPAAA